MGKLHRSPQYDPADKVELNKDEAKAVKEHIEDRLNTRIQEDAQKYGDGVVWTDKNKKDFREENLREIIHSRAKVDEITNNYYQKMMDSSTVIIESNPVIKPYDANKSQKLER